MSLILQLDSFQEYHLLIDKPANGYCSSSPAPILVYFPLFPLFGSFTFFSAQVLWEQKQAPSGLVTSLKNKESKEDGLGCSLHT